MGTEERPHQPQESNSSGSYKLEEIITILSGFFRFPTSSLEPEKAIKATDVNGNARKGPVLKRSDSCPPRLFGNLLKMSSLKKRHGGSEITESDENLGDTHGSRSSKNRTEGLSRSKSSSGIGGGDDGSGSMLKLSNMFSQLKSTFERRKKSIYSSVKSLDLDPRSNELLEMLRYNPDSIKSNEVQSRLQELLNHIVDMIHCDMYLPGLHFDLQSDASALRGCLAFEEVILKFQSLSLVQKLCLLCFAVFPENKEVKKTMLMHWWMGEDYAKTEVVVDEILKELTAEELIVLVDDTRKRKPNSYKMDSLVHSVVIFLANFLGLFYIYDGDKGRPIMKKSNSEKVCLVERSSWQDEAKVSKMNREKLQTVFNISERFPDFTFKWFSKMFALKVLYLGRWERSAERHIEVESTELMKDMKSMSKLKLLSFQGISRIESLSGASCKLRNLIILDLRACYNLETLPDNIDMLENLIYLDVSECYMMDRMPKKMSFLSKLQVLKGFVVSDAEEESVCKLADLKGLKNLRKLSININRKFEWGDLANALERLSSLQSLKLAWGALSSVKKDGNHDRQNGDKEEKKQVNPFVESEMKRLDVQETKAETPFKIAGEKKGETPFAESENTISNKKEDEKVDSKKQTGNGKQGSLAEKMEQENAAAELKDMTQTKKEDSKGESKEQTNQDEKTDATNAKGDVEEAKTSKLEKTEEKKKQEDQHAESQTTTQKKEVNSLNGDNMEQKGHQVERQGLRENELNPKVDNKQVSETKEADEATRVGESVKQTTRMAKFGGLFRQLGKKREDVKPQNIFPSSLTKLELECLPEADLEWHEHENLDHLKKLYIRGGKLRSLGKFPNVEILRLKYLEELKEEWRELQALFPKLKLLEKYKCPKVTLCPCDGNGVWRDEGKGS